MKKGQKQIIKVGFLARNIERELDTVYKMIRIYCRANHGTKNEICNECFELYKYAEERTLNCTFGDDKPECGICPVHCYKKDKREKIREIMRFSGPRMIFFHPWLAIVHVSRKLTRIFESKISEKILN